MLSLYFPMQKSLKITSKISSVPTFPVILPKQLRLKRSPSAASARSMSLYLWYWLKDSMLFCRLVRWRVWVRLGLPTRGSAHLERKGNKWRCYLNFLEKVYNWIILNRNFMPWLGCVQDLNKILELFIMENPTSVIGRTIHFWSAF